MVSALDSGSSGPGSGPGQGTLCCVLGQRLFPTYLTCIVNKDVCMYVCMYVTLNTLTVPLSTHING